ncbi:MAG: sulfurtransferase TusA family protein [Gammaproteobacteria bacterium]|jgi:tRNA 2-thiouridine synthesizing protein A|nr:MAG: sulfurtransferase TusA family protein [Gammaproteobacteria bacterium]
MQPQKKYDVMYDAGGNGCGQLLIYLKVLFDSLATGTTVCIKTYDSGAPRDLEAWCRMRNHTLIEVNGAYVTIRK